MPTAFIPKIGDVEYTRKALPEGIKGKAVIGVLEAPIMISEDLGPGAKLDYVVSHEVGHRLTLDMIVNAYEDAPTFFTEAPSPTAGLIKYFISLGLTRRSINPRHPGTKTNLNKIFDLLGKGEYPDEDTSREFIAEVFANWSMSTGDIPPGISERFASLVKSKNKILKSKVSHLQEAAFLDNNDSKQTVILLLAGLGVIWILGNL